MAASLHISRPAASLHISRPAADALTGRRSLARRLAGHLGRSLETRAQRQALAALDPHLLADLGISRAQAVDEAARPLWDVPAGWRK